MQVKETMSKTPCFVRPETSLREAAEFMRDRDCGCLPVGENDRLVGMLTDRDITLAVAKGVNPREGTAGEAMSEGIKYCFEDISVEEAAELMKKHKIRRLVVLNRNKRMTGIISLGDLAASCKDKKLVGEIEGAVCHKAA